MHAPYHSLVINLLVSLLILASASACGFHLRGEHLGEFKQTPVYLNAGGTSVATEVRKQLQIAEIPIAASADQADYVITLANESFDRSVLSVSPQTGNVEEYQLSYQVFMSVTGPDGNKLIDSESITAERDYTFDDTNALGKFEEDTTLRIDIRNQAAVAVMRRLEAIARQN